MPPTTRNTARNDDGDSSTSNSDENRPRRDCYPAAAICAATAPSPEMSSGALIGISEDQLARLIGSIMRNVVTPSSVGERHADVPTPTPSSVPGNFSRCTARFDGTSSRSADDFEAFIDSVIVFKECANVSDEHALRGLSMLLTNDAAVWWRGIKNLVTTWEEAVRRLRAMYGTPRPAHKIFRDIFAQEQGSERVDSFIPRVRANFSRLPYSVPEVIQLDIVYGLLDRRIRKRVPRDSVSAGLDCLLERARYVEEALSEVSASQFISAGATHASHSSSLSKTSSIPQSQKSDDSAHRAIYRAVNTSTSGSGFNPTSAVDLQNSPQKRVRPQCSACYRFGHVVDDCRTKSAPAHTNTADSADPSFPNKNNSVSCYGCGKVGTVRSRCETCKLNANSAIDISKSKIEFHTIEIESTDRFSPTVHIEVTGRTGVAVLDTGATQSIASPGLYAILVNSGVKFIETRRLVGLADGTQQVKNLLTCHVDVTLQGRRVPTTFLVLPGAENRTLLGCDFISRANLALDLCQGIWSFTDTPEGKFTFVNTYTLVSPTLPSTQNAELLCINTNSIPRGSPLGTRHGQMSDPELRNIIEDMEAGDADYRGRGWSSRGSVLSDGVLYRYGPEGDGDDAACLVIPRHERQKILEDFRNSPTAGHLETVPTALMPDLKRLTSVLTEARDVHEKAQTRSKKYADENRRPAPDYGAGDHVLLKTQRLNEVERGQTSKFIPRRDGPYRVAKATSPTTCELDNPITGEFVGKYHVSHLSPYVGPIEPPVRESRNEFLNKSKVHLSSIKSPLALTSEKFINETIEKTWNLTTIFKYVLRYAGSTQDECSQYFYYEAVFSQPSAAYPVPQATVSVFFRVEEKHLEPPEVRGVPNVFFRIEGQRSRHDVRYEILTADWILAVLKMKLKIFQRIESLRLF